MEVRKILGNIILHNGNHAIAKLANGHYAVGNLHKGNSVPVSEQFHDFDKAFKYWYETLYMLTLHELHPQAHSVQ